MSESIQVRLPASDLGGNRNFSVGLGWHGDLNLAFWRGEDPGTDTATKRYFLTHGSDASLFGSMIGYYVRLGVDESTIRESFLQSAESILSEDRKRRISSSLSSAAILAARGERRRPFDRPALGWDCLMTPTPMVPGSNLEGGTGLYTTDTDRGLRLVVARTMPEQTPRSQERAAATYLGPDDAPVIAQAIADNAMGDYRDDIAVLLRKRFPTLE